MNGLLSMYNIMQILSNNIGLINIGLLVKKLYSK